MIVTAYMHTDVLWPVEYVYGGDIQNGQNQGRAVSVRLDNVFCSYTVDPQELARRAVSEFRALLEMQRDVKYPVMEIVLSPSPTDLFQAVKRQGNNVLIGANQLAEELLDASQRVREYLGFRDHATFSAIHHDGHSKWRKAHGYEDLPIPHCHIVASRLSWTESTAVTINALIPRLVEAGRKIELEFGFETLDQSRKRITKWKDLRAMMVAALPEMRSVLDLVAVPLLKDYSLRRRDDGTLWIGAPKTHVYSPLAKLGRRWAPEELSAQVAQGAPITSAALQNAEDVCEWLKTHPQGMHALQDYRQHVTEQAAARTAYLRKKKKAEDEDDPGAPTALGLERFLQEQGLQQLLRATLEKGPPDEGAGLPSAALENTVDPAIAAHRAAFKKQKNQRG